MPISINEYATPRWTKMRERYPWSLDKNYRYRNLTINPRHPVERYAGDDRGMGWKDPGYNPNHDSIRTERVNLNTDTTEQQYKPY